LTAGAPRAAASDYVSAAEQTELEVGTSAAEREQAAVGAARLWESAAGAASTGYDVEAALSFAERASELYRAHGHARAAARTQAIAGDVLRRAGRHSEARELLSAALVVLRPEPDADTVTALDHLAGVEIFSGGPEAERLATEALALGQALDVDAGLLADLFINRGIAVYFANRWAESVAYLEYAAKLAQGAGDSSRQARALLNLAEVLSRSDPVAAAAAARTAADLARRGGATNLLDVAVNNEAQALLLTGGWDQADLVIRDVLETDRPGDFRELFALASLMAALRGDAETATTYAELPGMRASEDSQDQATVSLCDAFIAAARDEPAEALRHARATFVHLAGLGVAHIIIQWAWPLAARSAHQLGDTESVTELLTLLDGYPVGHLSPLLRAERGLARARLADKAEESGAESSLVIAIAALRQVASPYHLAQGLLDYAEHLGRADDRDGVRSLVAEARAIAEPLRARLLIDRAERVLVDSGAEEVTAQLQV
jgi:tetratricopeptide (TPR) repeat protein